VRAILEFVEEAIREDPAAWSHLVKFLKKWMTGNDSLPVAEPERARALRYNDA